ncbi:MAG TPA: UDP-3-O-acyl-N-acetylglucosamine deacetylase [Thermoanaerobaculia bacterium]|nr:UDP-3-O-acyl-N-acetylglucosamine deacetylase [Thermoanaerobaculia bacterium]
MTIQRKTISTPVAIEGIGIHSGIYTKVELHPAAAGAGLTFIRTDLHHLRIPALLASTTALDYATSVGKDDVSIGTVEHLLSAVHAAGITDLDIRIDGPEVPIIDGSALPFVHLIEAAGTRELGETISAMRIRRPIEVADGIKKIRIEPADHLSIEYGIDFDHPTIGRQRVAFDYDYRTFANDIAPARTYGFLRDVEKLRAAGLARGGSVENCIVLDDSGVMNGPLRFGDEFVRHKVLDLLGDLALLGRPIRGKITASRAGHALHSQLVAAILREQEAWELESEESDTATAAQWA